MEAEYKWQDYFTRQQHKCRCEVIDRTATRVTIRLKGYGPKGKPPGTLMKVKPESVGIRKETQHAQLDLSWHEWTD